MGRRRGFRRRYILLALLGLIILGYMIFANTLIKSVLEARLSESYGAEVNIGEFDHSLFPPSVEMQDIGLTNASKPAFNQVLIGTLHGDVELLPLLSNQVVVNQLSVLEVKFDQPRAQPGEVYRQPQQPLSLDAVKSEVKAAIPTVDELLARSALKSTQAAQQARQTYDQHATALKKQYQQLPGEQRLKEYKARVKALKETDYKDPQALLNAQQTLETLKQEIVEDKTRFSDFAANARQAQQALQQTAGNLAKAPGQDYDLLKNALTGDSAALNEITEMVFGDKAAEYTGYLMSAFEIVVPLLQGQGEQQSQAEDMPAVLVRKANVSVNWQDERIESSWDNITNIHSEFGQPTTFAITAAGQWLKQFESTGQFWIDDSGVDASQSWQLAGIDLNGIQFAGSDHLTAALQHALLNTQGNLSISDNQLTGEGVINLAELAMQASGDSKLTQAMATALNSLSSLAMNLSLDGTLDDPGFHLKSDLDNQLARSALAQLSASQQDKLDELNHKLNAIVSREQQATDKELVNVEQMLALAQGNTAELEKLLSTELNNRLEQEKDKWLNKLKSRLGDN